MEQIDITKNIIICDYGNIQSIYINLGCFNQSGMF